MHKAAFGKVENHPDPWLGGSMEEAMIVVVPQKNVEVVEKGKCKEEDTNDIHE
jgi:hypothetical protein